MYHLSRSDQKRFLHLSHLNNDDKIFFKILTKINFDELT